MSVTTTKQLTDKLRAELRSGQLTVVPSTRSLALQHGLHRNTCLKALQKLAEEGLIDLSVGRVGVPLSTGSNPVDKAIDHLLNLGFSLEQSQAKILESLNRRRKITVIGENKELLKSELEVEGFNMGDNGLEVSDDPSKGDFLLMLSNLKDLGLDKPKVSSIGIISEWDNYRLHIKGCLHNKFTGDIIEATPRINDVNSILHFCRIIICDRLIEVTLKDFAKKYREKNGGVNKIIAVPYLNSESINQLRRKVCS